MMEYPERDCLDGSSSKELRATIAQQQTDIEALITAFNVIWGDCWCCDGDTDDDNAFTSVQPIIERYQGEKQ